MNKLETAISKSKPIKGIKGFVKLQDERYNSSNKVYVPVTVKGISIGPDSCGLSIKAETDGGYGELTITPCQLFDSIDSVKERIELVARQKKQKDALYGITRWSTVNGRRRALIEFVGKANKTTLAIVEQELKDRNCENIDKLTSCGIQPIAEMATKAEFGLLDTPEVDD